MTPAASHGLETEAAVLGKYILGRPIEPQFITRYVAAHQFLEMEGGAGEAAILALGVRYPIVLGSLDAAAALLRPHSMLHRKAILLTAILEASPRYADRFLPRTRGWISLMALLARVGVGTAFRLLIGTPLLLIVERRG